MSFDDILDLLAAISLLLGAFLSVAAGIGLLRFPDALSRMHAATKPQILGLIFVVIAIALSSRSWSTLLVLAPVLVFQMLLTQLMQKLVIIISILTHLSSTVLKLQMVLGQVLFLCRQTQV